MYKVFRWTSLNSDKKYITNKSKMQILYIDEYLRELKFKNPIRKIGAAVWSDLSFQIK